MKDNTCSYYFELTFKANVLLIIITAFSGCTSTTEKRFSERTYVVGNTLTVTQGNVIASELQGDVETKRNWVGVMRSDDGWGSGYLTFSDDFIERKLYYLGFDEGFLHILYREYKQGNEHPSISQSQKFDLNQTPYVSLSDFYLKVVSINDTQASFLLFDEPTWGNDKNNFRLAEDKRKKEEKLEQIVRATKTVRNEAQAAKNYAEQFVKFTPTFGSFSQATTEFDNLDSIFNETRKDNYSTDQLIKIFYKIENQYSRFSQFFTLVATSLEAWSAMDDDLRKAAQSGIGKEYFAMALDIKTLGEQALQVEQFLEATQKFKHAREEIKRVTTYFQKTAGSNLE